jgi:hypothetical protein
MTDQFSGERQSAFPLDYLRSRTPQQRLSIAFELSEAAKRKWLRELRQRFPDATEAEFRAIVKEHLLQQAEEELRVYNRRKKA